MDLLNTYKHDTCKDRFMKKYLRLCTVCLFALGMTGCVDRDYADNTLQKGCLAGVKALLDDGYEIRDVKEAKFEPSPVGPDFRHVTLQVTQMDGWLETDAEYQCVFEESFGFLNSHHTASIYQIRMGDDRLVGRSGKDIIGTPEDFLKLTDAIRKAMYE